MKKITLILFSMFLVSCSTSWLQKANSPEPIYRAKAIRIDNKTLSDIIVVGGVTRNFANHSDLNLSYNTSNDSWTYLTPIPVGKSEHSIAKLNKKIYVFGGIDQGNLTPDDNKTVYEYDIHSDSWSQKNDLPFSFTQGATVGVPELERIYVFGGNSHPNGIYNDYVYEYNPLTDNYIRKSQIPMLAGIQFAATLLKDGNIYISGGKIANTVNETNELWKYNPRNDTWTQLVDMPYSISLHSSATTPDGNVLTIIGNKNFDFLPFANNQFRNLPSRNNTVSIQKLCAEYVLDNKGQRVGVIFVFGGNNNRYNNTSAYKVEAMH